MQGHSWDMERQREFLAKSQDKGPHSAKGANQQLVKIAQDALQAYQDIEQDLYIPSDAKAEILVQKKADYEKQLNQAVTAAKKAAETERLQARVSAARQYFPKDKTPYELAADEKSWRRMQGLLDAGIDPAAVLQDAVDRGDQRTITVFDAEFQGYRWGQTGSLNDAQRETESLQPLLAKAAMIRVANRTKQRLTALTKQAGWNSMLPTMLPLLGTL
jgi:hypothetical protein